MCSETWACSGRDARSRDRVIAWSRRTCVFRARRPGTAWRVSGAVRTRRRGECSKAGLERARRAERILRSSSTAPRSAAVPSGVLIRPTPPHATPRSYRPPGGALTSFRVAERFSNRRHIHRRSGGRSAAARDCIRAEPRAGASDAQKRRQGKSADIRSRAISARSLACTDPVVVSHGEDDGDRARTRHPDAGNGARSWATCRRGVRRGLRARADFGGGVSGVLTGCHAREVRGCDAGSAFGDAGRAGCWGFGGAGSVF